MDFFLIKIFKIMFVNNNHKKNIYFSAFVFKYFNDIVLVFFKLRDVNF